MKDNSIFEKTEDDYDLKIFMEWLHSERESISFEDLVKECGFSDDDMNRQFQPPEG